MAACRDVGLALLEEGDIASAYNYLHMIDEIDPLRDYIEQAVTTPDALPAVIDVALARGVHPARGVSLVLEHYGLCHAITACESLMSSMPSHATCACIATVVRATHEELTRRLRDEIVKREGTPPVGHVRDWLDDRRWLFENDNYHLDTSHLNAVVRMARVLPQCDETHLAIDLCSYGNRLSEKYRYPDPCPFENVYADTQRYLEVIAGLGGDEHLAYFRAKADAANPLEVGTYPAEIHVHLLRSTGRIDEAIAYAEKHLNEQAGSASSTVNEICQSAGDYEAMARLARRRGDVLSYAAALIAASAVRPE